MKITVVTGSRADYGMLEWPIKLLQADPFFDVSIMDLRGTTFGQANYYAEQFFIKQDVDVLLLLGDRFEVLSAAITAHLRRIPIAHIAGGDVTEGSYDDAMRDSISRMASIHFVTSTSAMARLTHMGYRNVHLVGSPGIDYIKHADWKRERPYSEPYVVVSYQPETIGDDDAGQSFISLWETLPDCKRIVLMPNPDRGSIDLRSDIITCLRHQDTAHDFFPHAEFLNLIYHCDEFIGNSSAMLYEAPELEVKTRMIGKRQKGRVIPWGDGHASERILKILKYTHL